MRKHELYKALTLLDRVIFMYVRYYHENVRVLHKRFHYVSLSGGVYSMLL